MPSKYIFVSLVFILSSICGTEVCPPGEEYSNCIESIERLINCSEKDPYYCDGDDGDSNEKCTSACVCQAGYLRSFDGACVPESQCYGDLTCEDNEVASLCPDDYDDFCPSSENYTTKWCSSGDDSTAVGIPTCTCRFNSKRDPVTGLCIPTNQCPPFECSEPNQAFNPCPPICPTDDCSEATPTGRCPFPGRIGIVLECKPECRCIPGYWKKNGVCVPYSQCNQTCGLHEFLNECPNRCDVNSCPESFEKEQEYLRNCTAAAVCLPPQCQCLPNYRRDTNGVCIPIENCPNICGANEVLSNCTELICGGQSCSQIGKKFECPIVKEGSCTQGCICAPDYYKDANGNCISKEQCSSDLICGDNEIASLCPDDYDDFCPSSENYIIKRCSSIDDSSAVGTPTCTCRFNFRRDPVSGLCIPTNQCPPFECSEPNQEFNPCPPICPTDDCSQATPTGRCPFPGRIGIILECKPNCRCISGYWKKNGVCVPYSQCNQTCGLHEFLNECPNRCDVNSCPESFEKEQEYLRNCTAGAVCLPPQCQCLPNYRRDTNGVCIPIESCPNICGANQVLSNCTELICGGQSCSQIGKKLHCPIVKEGSCTQGCICAPNYYKDANSNCIPQEQCPNICGENEQYNKCPNGCDVTSCPESFQKEKEFRADCFAPAVCLQPQCQCVRNYRRDQNGKCIPIGDCPNICGTNEIFSTCTQILCRAQNCSELAQPVACPSIQEGSCIPDCACAYGFLRNEEGLCIPENQCPNTCGENEVLNLCPNECTVSNCPASFQQEQEYVKNCVASTACLPPLCQCLPNYRRDENGRCVPIESCPGICPINEEFSNCTERVCRILDCANRGQDIICGDVPDESCQSGCVCVDGTLRNENGVCIPINECNTGQQCGQNERLNQCPNGCDVTNCPVSLAQEQEYKRNCNAPAVCLEPQCQCLPNYRRNQYGLCIPIEDCPGICPNNEEYSFCAQATCRAQNCSQLGQPVPCPRIAEGFCIKDCVCIQGTLRNEYGDCVSEDQCPNSCGVNERLNQCPNGCDTPSCPVSLAHELEYKQNCVAPAVCLDPQCQCLPNYRRDENGVCIPIENCPGICPINEVYTNCTQRVCKIQECSQQGLQILCADVPDESCRAGCVCADGTLRNENEICIPESQCPAQQCGENERLNGCPNGCDVTNCPVNFQQEQEYKKDCFAPAVCLPPECQCIRNYRRAQNGTCIPIDMCPNICGENESFSYCSEGLCEAESCSQLGQPIPCPRGNTGLCNQSCICAQGFLRDENGRCIPRDQCPNPCGVNEFLNQCPGGCAVTDCPESFEREQEYRRNCVSATVCLPPRCQCLPNYRKNENGECIPIESCPGICPQNEVLSNCVEQVCRALDCSQTGQTIYCKSDNETCTQACVCAPGYLRNAQGYCIEENLCPNTSCPENEIYSECAITECTIEQCSEFDSPDCESVRRCSCRSGCVCITGTIRNEDGVCVVPECRETPTCKTNEKLECVQECPPETTCRTRGIFFSCLESKKPCQLKCVCKDGYFRNSIGECITNAQCDQCSGKNEYYSCGVECDNECETLSMQNKTNCPIVNIQCNKKCYCDDGFARPYKGSKDCVPIETCPKKTCGINEEYACKRTCPPETCLSLVAKFKCAEEAYNSCTDGCYCKSGYLRKSKDSPCIQICECDEMKNSPDCLKKNSYY